MPSVVFSDSYSISSWGAIQANVRLTFSETYNQSTNQTTLALTGLEFQKVGNTATYGSLPIHGNISVNGTTVCTIDNSGAGKMATVSLSGSGWCSASLSSVTRTNVVVNHNNDGTASCTVTLSGGYTSGSTYFCARYAWYHQSGNYTPQGYPLYITTQVPIGVRTTATSTMALTTRPRITSVSASGTYFGSPVTITLNRYNSAFTHTVTASCAGNTETLMTKGSTYPTLTWTPAIATYAPLITNAMSATATITCQTYNGSSLIGQSSTTLTLSLTSASVAPSVSIATSDPTGNLTTYGKYVKGKSKVTVTLTPTLMYGATLATVSITANGAGYTASPATTDFITSASNTTISATIKDSRGQSVTQTSSIDIYDYTAPQINAFSVVRCQSDGTEDSTGAYIKCLYDVTVTALGNNNPKTLKFKYKKTSDQNYTEQTITLSSYSESGASTPVAADTNSSYNTMLALTDNFSTAQAAQNVSTASSHVNHGAGASGGIGIGKVSEYNKTIEIAEDWTVTMGGLSVNPTLRITTPSFSSLPVTFYSDLITANHEIPPNTATFSNPSAIQGTLTWTTAAGSITFSGSISGSTTITFDLEIPNACTVT